MARTKTAIASALYDRHDRWLREVLPAGGSIYTPGQQIWTDANLAEIEGELEAIVSWTSERVDVPHSPEGFVDHESTLATVGAVPRCLRSCDPHHCLLVNRSRVAGPFAQRDSPRALKLSWRCRAPRSARPRTGPTVPRRRYRPVAALSVRRTSDSTSPDRAPVPWVTGNDRHHQIRRRMLVHALHTSDELPDVAVEPFGPRVRRLRPGRGSLRVRSEVEVLQSVCHLVVFVSDSDVGE